MTKIATNQGDYYSQRVIQYTYKKGRKRVLSMVENLIPKENSNKLSEVIYRYVFVNGKLSPAIATRTVYSDTKYGTNAVFNKCFSENPKAPSKNIEVNDRNIRKFKSYGYGYGDENMTELSERNWSEDGSYITREYFEYNGAINYPNCKGSCTDLYNKDAHLHYVNGVLYRTNPPVFYNNSGQVKPKH